MGPEPVYGISEIAPMELLWVIPCNCKSDTARSRISCTCKYDSLSCTSYCKCGAAEGICHNEYSKFGELGTSDETENDSEGDTD